MDRMGHSTTRAALIYQHRTSLRDKMIASNPHYQLGNQHRPGLSCGLTCGSGCPRVTVRDPSSPGLMAR